MVFRVFITVGTTRFDELLTEILRTKDVFNTMEASVRIQKGRSELTSQLVETDWDVYSYKPSLKEDLEWADMVISHAGSGSIIESLRMNKACLVVVNEQLMDNHQKELAYELDKAGYLVACTVKDFRKRLVEFPQRQKDLKPFPGAQADLFVQLLNEMAGF